MTFFFRAIQIFPPTRVRYVEITTHVSWNYEVARIVMQTMKKDSQVKTSKVLVTLCTMYSGVENGI